MEKHKIVQLGYGEQVYQHLKHMILSRELTPGERIPEGRIATLFNVSRTPIREAIKKLNEYGLVETFPRSFSVVTKISTKQAIDIGELRTAYENFALHLIFQKKLINDKLLKTLRKASDESVEAMQGNKDWEKAFEKDTEFHHAIISAADNEYLSEAFEKLDTRIQLVRLNMNVTPETFIEDIRQHYGVIEMLESGNEEEAIKRLDSHIYNSFTLYQIKKEQNRKNRKKTLDTASDQ